MFKEGWTTVGVFLNIPKCYTFHEGLGRRSSPSPVLSQHPLLPRLSLFLQRAPSHGEKSAQDISAYKTTQQLAEAQMAPRNL